MLRGCHTHGGIDCLLKGAVGCYDDSCHGVGNSRSSMRSRVRRRQNEPLDHPVFGLTDAVAGDQSGAALLVTGWRRVAEAIWARGRRGVTGRRAHPGAGYQFGRDLDQAWQQCESAPHLRRCDYKFNY